MLSSVSALRMPRLHLKLNFALVTSVSLFSPEYTCSSHSTSPGATDAAYTGIVTVFPLTMRLPASLSWLEVPFDFENTASTLQPVRSTACPSSLSVTVISLPVSPSTSSNSLLEALRFMSSITGKLFLISLI